VDAIGNDRLPAGRVPGWAERGRVSLFSRARSRPGDLKWQEGGHRDLRGRWCRLSRICRNEGFCLIPGELYEPGTPPHLTGLKRTNPPGCIGAIVVTGIHGDTWVPGVLRGVLPKRVRRPGRSPGPEGCLQPLSSAGTRRGPHKRLRLACRRPLIAGRGQCRPGPLPTTGPRPAARSRP
jgi:hypothetical protein